MNAHLIAQTIQVAMNMLQANARGRVMPSAFLAIAIQIISFSIIRSETWKLVKPKLGDLIQSLLFPLFCYEKEDAKLFEEDPEEFLRREYDPEEEFYDHRQAMKAFFYDSIKFRGGDSLLTSYVTFLNEILTSYVKVEPEKRNVLQKEGVMRFLGALSSILKESDQYQSQLQNLIQVHVLPEFHNKYDFIRARVDNNPITLRSYCFFLQACWLFSEFWYYILPTLHYLMSFLGTLTIKIIVHFWLVWRS